jgi:hypothetical protein
MPLTEEQRDDVRSALQYTSSMGRDALWSRLDTIKDQAHEAGYEECLADQDVERNRGLTEADRRALAEALSVPIAEQAARVTAAVESIVADAAAAAYGQGLCDGEYEAVRRVAAKVEFAPVASDRLSDDVKSATEYDRYGGGALEVPR